MIESMNIVWTSYLISCLISLAIIVTVEHYNKERYLPLAVSICTMLGPLICLLFIVAAFQSLYRQLSELYCAYMLRRTLINLNLLLNDIKDEVETDDIRVKIDQAQKTLNDVFERAEKDEEDA
jgi:hypothetical protein